MKADPIPASNIIEIAFEKGYINREALIALAQPLKKNGYGQYLLSRAKENELYEIY